MNYQLCLFVMMVGFGALTLLSFLVESLLNRIHLWLTCMVAGLWFSIMDTAMIHHWISADPDWFTWEALTDGDPWPRALARAIIILAALSSGTVLFFHSFGMRKLQRQKNDANNRRAVPRSLRQRWN